MDDQDEMLLIGYELLRSQEEAKEQSVLIEAIIGAFRHTTA